MVKDALALIKGIEKVRQYILLDGKIQNEKIG
jgi:hypothetical protein